jgi:hypothetical protein
VLGWCNWDCKDIYTVLNCSDEVVLQVIIVVSCTVSILLYIKSEYKPSGARSGPAVRRGTSIRFSLLQRANRCIVPVIGTDSFQKNSLVTYISADDGSRSSHRNVVFCFRISAVGQSQENYIVIIRSKFNYFHSESFQILYFYHKQPICRTLCLVK